MSIYTPSASSWGRLCHYYLWQHHCWRTRKLLAGVSWVTSGVIKAWVLECLCNITAMCSEFVWTTTYKYVNILAKKNNLPAAPQKCRWRHLPPSLQCLWCHTKLTWRVTPYCLKLDLAPPFFKMAIRAWVMLILLAVLLKVASRSQ